MMKAEPIMESPELIVAKICNANLSPSDSCTMLKSWLDCPNRTTPGTHTKRR
jgi:hypothetical protein